jgi:acyl-CoA synthetase (AMP-forming)/AMP-acid ligase II
MIKPLLQWLEEPTAKRGIRFAGAEPGEWEFWSYERLAGLARKVARGLAGHGVSRGDIVTIIQPSGPHFVATLFGAMLAGAIPSPVAPPIAFQDSGRYDEHVRTLVRRAASAAVVTSRHLLGRIRTVVTGGTHILCAEELTADHDREFHQGRQPAGLALVQFTSGSSGNARGVRVTFEALEANCAAIRGWLQMTADDPLATWLPLHHDMGLIGCLITPVTHQSDIWIMEPSQFIQSPLRYLRCFGALGATVTGMPNFGLAYIVRRVRPEQLEGLDFSQWRALVIGAERIDAGVLAAFMRLLGPHGLSRKALLPAYGLAEATLAVTGLPLAEEPTSLLAVPGSCEPGKELQVLPEVAGAAPDSDIQCLVGCGYPLAGVDVKIVGESGEPLQPGQVGEIVVRGSSVAQGYLPDGTSPGTVFHAGTLNTGDAGVIVADQLYVLGRLGDSMKVRGRSLFAEDLEALITSKGVPTNRVVVLLGVHRGEPTAVAVVERCTAAWRSDIAAALHARLEGARALIIDVPRATIERTSSGKPRRRVMWRRFAAGTLPGECHPA